MEISYPFGTDIRVQTEPMGTRNQGYRAKACLGVQIAVDYDGMQHHGEPKSVEAPFVVDEIHSWRSSRRLGLTWEDQSWWAMFPITAPLLVGEENGRIVHRIPYLGRSLRTHTQQGKALHRHCCVFVFCQSPGKDWRTLEAYYVAIRSKKYVFKLCFQLLVFTTLVFTTLVIA